MQSAQLETIIGKHYVTDGLEYLAVYLPNNKLVSIIHTKNNKYVDPSKLENLVQTYQEKEAVREGVKSINEFNNLMIRYVNSGEKYTLDKFLTDNGYSPSRILEGREASNIIDQAVAYTDTETVLGVYLNFKKAIEKMARQGKIPDEVARYIAVTHELIHTAQGSNLESLVADEKAYKLNVEYEAEMLLTALLYHKAATSKSEKGSREWYSAARYTLHRAQILGELARRKNIPLDKKEKLTEMVENYFHQYANKETSKSGIFAPVYNPI